jgi:23S rRNA (pseudouridine1915-N3)-methyltransferase
MLSIMIVAIGTIKESYLLDGVTEFKKRLSRYVNLDILEIPESPLMVHASESEIDKALDRDAKTIMQNLPKKSYVVALDIQGKMMTSEALATKLDTLMNQTPAITLLLGGSHGLHLSLNPWIKEKWSFSTLTFPHQLFRLMLLEQLYRSMTILKGHPYHK